MKQDTSFSHMVFSLMASSKNGIDYIFLPNILHIFGIEFFVFFQFHIGKPLTSSCFHEFWIYEFLSKDFRFSKSCKEPFFAVINNFLSVLISMTKQIKLKFLKFYLYLQNSWKHVMNFYLVPIYYGPLNFSIEGQFLW